MTLNEEQKEKALESLLWIVAFPGIVEGNGGVQNSGGNVGTGLRQPNAALYNVPKNKRSNIIKILKDCECITEENGKYYPTEKGIERASRENKIMVSKQTRYREDKYILDYTTYFVNTNESGYLRDKINYKVYLDYSGKYEETKNLIKQEIKDGKREKAGWIIK